MDSYTLKSVMDLPPPFRSVFSFRYFNSLQSECFPTCYHSDVNMVISAPTGSGKTVLFELCILRLLSKSITEGMQFVHEKGTLKTIYIAPSKALVQEKLRDWSQKFGSWGINCLELTGDTDTYSTRNLQEADIILTTPEKFDAVTRYRIRDGGLSYFSDIALLVIDEVHLLNDPRGAALEAIISRIKMLSRNPHMRTSALAHVRLLAVSATIPNLEDLAQWLMVPVEGMKRFGEEMRPVKLTTTVLGYTPAKNDFLFEKRLQNFIFDVLMQYSKGKSALVFCSTRKGAQEAAQRLSHTVMTFGYSNPFIKTKEQQERLREASLGCGDKQMQSYIPYGVAFHHGGLSMKDRNLVEGLFLKGDIQVLCTTNTLAHGINLPAHTVVIKSTRNFNKEKGLYMEYDRSTILQMCGRAGRPPFDDTGIVIIMTRKETVHLYENLLNGCEVVESQLLSCVTEHLTAEIVQMTITDIARAIEWIKCSYLYVRMRKDPGNYAIEKAILKSQIEKHMKEICIQQVKELSRHHLIWTDEEGFLLKPLEPGRLMTKYYLKFETMKYIMQGPENCSLEDALHIVCRAEEIAWIQLRRNEKKLLNDINADKSGRLRFHVIDDKGKPKKRIQSREEKIFVLTNDLLTGDPLVHDLSMTQDTNSICSNGSRVAKCMKEYFIYKNNYKGALNSILLAKSLHQKLWDDSKYLLKQLPGIGMVTAKALHSMEVDSFEKLSSADPRKIEIVTGRKYPFGNQIKESLQSLPPKVELKIEETESPGQGKVKLLLTLTKGSESILSNKRYYADMIVSSEEDNLILLHQKIRVDEFSSPYNATILVSQPWKGKLTVNAHLLHEEYLGVDVHQKLVLKDKSSITNHKRRSKKSSCSSPYKEVCIRKDDQSAKVKAQLLDIDGQDKSKRADNSMPSFNLVDEESGEEEQALTAEDNECKFISVTTVFDHIREKAKCFPSLVTSGTSSSPSSQLLNLKRKCCLEKLLDPHIQVEDLDVKEGKKIPQHAPVSPLRELPEMEPSNVDISGNIVGNQQAAAKTSGALTGTGESPAGPEDSTCKTLIGETIFDLIRKKSKKFPAFNGRKTGGSKSPNSAICVCNKQHDPYMSKTIENGTPGILSVEPVHFRKNSSDKYEKTIPSYNASDADGYISSGNMLDFDISMIKNTNGTYATDKESSIRSGKKQKFSPKVPGINGCPDSTAAKTKDDSFLGFSSVFSFL